MNHAQFTCSIIYKAVAGTELPVSITNPAWYPTKRYLTAVAQKHIVSKLGEWIYIQFKEIHTEIDENCVLTNF